MKLSKLRIQNFRSCRDVRLDLKGMHALVGANNAGKSAVLRALDFLFNPSAKNLGDETFWNKDTQLEIRVEALFVDLEDGEKEALDPYLKPDGTFHMARSARLGGRRGEAEPDAEQDEDKITIGQHYLMPMPESEWLQDSKINAKSIAEWWKDKDGLIAGGVNFADSWTDKNKKPGVEDWKEKARTFVAAYSDRIPMKDAWVDNPKGYPNVLKRTLPFFVLVPAVRDVAGVPPITWTLGLWSVA
jgi:putative ATP-dependent endonuclease of OLD family